MQKNIKTNSAQRGFTLVELSIVLVIIGLIVGGVLVGQSLIQAAKVRAQLTQLDQLDAAMNAFRAKFDCLPGDCAAASGVTNAAGDGNGLIAYSSTWADDLESALAWSQMSSQGMVSGTFTPNATFSTGQIGAAKLGGFIMIGADTTTNYYALANYAADLATTPAIAADAARTIDAKRDDGIPETGSTVAVDDSNDPFGAVDFPADSGNLAACVDTAGIYQTGSKTATCTLRVRASG